MHRFMGLKFLAGLGLLAGVGLVACRMAELRHEMLTEGDREGDGPGGPREFSGHHHLRHGHWHRRVPPMFEYWHRQAHAQDQAPTPEAEKAKSASEPAKA